jgi:hypothetical protein
MAITQWHGPSSPATRYRPDLLATGHVRQNYVKGSRTPATGGWFVLARVAGVGEASGEETAGGRGSVLLGDGAMGNSGWSGVGTVA